MAAKARHQFRSKDLKLIVTRHSKQFLPIVKLKIQRHPFLLLPVGGGFESLQAETDGSTCA
jgi:hypothetical protein